MKSGTIYPRDIVRKTCPFCGCTFPTRKTNQTFCSRKCRYSNAKKNYRHHNVSPMVSSGTRGAISELMVCTDLLSKGYDVFRSVSPASPCDLAILKGGKLYRVEVRTGYLSASGNPMYRKNTDDDKTDLYAIIIADEIKYIPGLPT